MENELRTLIDEQVNPVLANHSGGCEVVSLENGIATIKLLGNCCGCHGKIYTFNQQVVPFLLKHVSGLKEIILK